MEWTALGAIATAIAVIVALIANYRTNKNNEENRKLQVALLCQQRAQKKLDEMVQNVMQLSQSMRPRDILFYSSKLMNNTFTEEDRYSLGQFTIDTGSGAVNIVIQMVMLRNYDSMKPILDCLVDVFDNYEIWSRSVTTLLKNKSKYEGFGHVLDGNDVEIEGVINEMKEKSIKYNSWCRAQVEAVLEREINPYDRAIALMPFFMDAMAKYIQKRQQTLYMRLLEFVGKEQRRIDDIVQ